MGVSKNRGTPKSLILYPFWGTRIFGNTDMESKISLWQKKEGPHLPNDSIRGISSILPKNLSFSLFGPQHF